MKNKLIVLALTLGSLISPISHANRDHIMIVGSSTVFPFSKVVAERFGLASGMKAPKVEPTGTGGGFKEFCKGVGVSYPDIANASRRIKKSEFDACQAAGVKEIVEVKVGYDGIVLSNSIKSQPMSLTRRDIYLALAKKIPDPKGTETLVDNPHKTWKQVNAALPDVAIKVFGPPPTSGTRDAFVELAMEAGCSTFPWVAALKEKDEQHFKAVCHGIREDGPFVEAGENDNLIVRKLDENPTALGIFGFSFLDQNADKVQASKIENISATFEAISDGSYSVARPLYFYVKKAHLGVIPGIDAYLKEFTSGRAWGEDGYLAEKGMIPLHTDERKKYAQDVKDLKVLAL